MGEGDPAEAILDGCEEATGERPRGCPWRSYADPYVAEVLRVYRWWKAGQLEARYAYEKCLSLVRLSGTATGRAAAANSALNLASMLEDEVGEGQRREWFAVAIALGKSSRTALGADVARNAEKGLARLDGRGEDGE